MKTVTRSYHQNARAMSTEATGQRIADAFLTRLMEQWFDEITLEQVAGDADVTVQTVVRRFGGKDGLLTKAVEILAAQIKAQRVALPDDINQSVHNLVGDYERTGDAVIRLLALEPRHAALQTVLNTGRGQHRQWVNGAFAEALVKLDATTRQRAVDALVIATDVYTWKLLRRDMGRSVRATSTTIKELIDSTLAQFTNQPNGQPTNKQ